MIFDEEVNQLIPCSKTQSLCTGSLHGSVIWSKHMDTNNETIFGMGAFFRVVGLGKDKIFWKLLQSKITEVYLILRSDLEENPCNFRLKNNFENF